MSHYVEDVHDVARMIPPGRVTTYGAIADFLTLGSARMVGFAMKQSIGADGIPAHRVLNRKGELSGRNALPDADGHEGAPGSGGRQGSQ